MSLCSECPAVKRVCTVPECIYGQMLKADVLSLAKAQRPIGIDGVLPGRPDCCNLPPSPKAVKIRRFLGALGLSALIHGVVALAILLTM